MRVALAARHVGKLDPLVAETHARAFACDAADAAQVEALFERIDPPDLVVYNPSYRVRGPFLGLDRRGSAEDACWSRAYGGFLVAQAALAAHGRARARRAVLHRRLGERQGLCRVGALRHGQVRAARPGAEPGARVRAEEHPRRALRHRRRHRAAGGDARAAARGEDGMLEPDAIAETYMAVYRQHRSAWSFEVDLRPWVEKF